MASVLEVSAATLIGNVRAVERVLAGDGETPALLGVVKANAYGHSARLCAPVLVGAGVRWLGVTDAEEGATVRESLGGAEAEILVMSGPPGDRAGALEAARAARLHQLTPVVWSMDQIRLLVEDGGVEPRAIHVEVDTGMSRQGVGLGELDALLAGLAGEPRVRVDGVFTHLASAESASGEQTGRQMGLFEEAVTRIVGAGFAPEWVHVGNASLIDNGAVEAVRRLRRLAESVGSRAMVRCGLGLYGYCLPLEGLGEARLRGAVRPVLEWKTMVSAVEEIGVGTTVGYGATFVAKGPMRLALLPVGYADGLRREMSSRGWVVMRGRRAGIVGRVSMNLTVVDVTEFNPPVRVGEIATLLGDGTTAEDHAGLCGTIPYEILCGLRGRPIRV